MKVLVGVAIPFILGLVVTIIGMHNAYEDKTGR